MLQFATAPLSIGQVWGNGIRLTRERLLPLYILFLINQLIIVATLFFMGGNNDSMFDNFKYRPVSMVGIFIISAILTLIIYAVGFHVLGTLLKGQPRSFMASVQYAFKKLPVLFLASLLSFFATVLGCLALVIPGIYIAIVMFYYFPAIIVDDMPIVAAFKYTFSIVWGNWWRAFIVVAVPIVVALFINGIFTFIVMFCAYFIQPEGGSHMAVSYVDQGFNILFQAYIDILILAVQLIQWNDLKIRRQLRATSA